MKKHHHSRLFSFAAFAGLTSLLPSVVRAEIDLFAEYRLGEDGTLGYGKSPQDSSGNGHHFTNSLRGGTSLIGTSGVAAPGSAAFLDTTSTSLNQGWVGVDFSTLPVDNIGYGVWVRAASGSSSRGTVFGLGTGEGSFNILLDSGGWRANNYVQSTWGTAPFVANTWIHLAVVRKDGVATFYANGTAVSGTSTLPPVNNEGRLSVTTGNNTFFDGLLDAARVVTFASTDSTADIVTALKDGPVVKSLYHVGKDGGVRSAALSTDKVSHFRIGTAYSDSAIVSAGGTLSVVAGTAAKHRIEVGFSGPVATGVYPLISYTGSIGGLGYDGLELAPLPGRLQGTLFHNTTLSRVELHITEGTADLTWTGGGNGVWGTGATGNWVTTTGGLPATYFQGDTVRFDGVATDTSVTISETVTPASVTFGGNQDYTFDGQGIAGFASVTKSGTGVITLNTPNTFSGGLQISGGRLKIGGTGTPGTADIVNDGELEFAGTGTLDVSRIISGTGPIWKTGSGNLILGGLNTFTGAFFHQAGIIKANGPINSSQTQSILGDISAGTIVSAGAVLDTNGRDFGPEPITIQGSGIDGSGSLVNTAATESYSGVWQKIEMTGDTTIGGSGDLGIQDLFDRRLLLTGAHKLTKKGSGKTKVYGVDATVKDIEITEGTLSIEYASVVDNDIPGTITVQPGGTLGLISHGFPAVVSKPIVMNGGTMSASRSAFAVAKVNVDAPIELQAPLNTFHAFNAIEAKLEVTGTGGLVKTGASTLTLEAIPSYTGTTRIEDGGLILFEPSSVPTGPLVIKEFGSLTFSFLTPGIHTVSTCIIDGQQLPAGDYDVAWDQTGKLFGEGILRVTTGPSGGAYATWANSARVAGESPEADTDHDGLANAIEFVIGSDPRAGVEEEGVILPSATLSEPGYVTFVFNRATASASFNPHVEYGTTLDTLNWTPAQNGVGGVTVQSVAAGAGMETVTVRVPRGTAPAMFLRLKVTITP